MDEQIIDRICTAFANAASVTGISGIGYRPTFIVNAPLTSQPPPPGHTFSRRGKPSSLPAVHSPTGSRIRA